MKIIIILISLFLPNALNYITSNLSIQINNTSTINCPDKISVNNLSLSIINDYNSLSIQNNFKFNTSYLYYIIDKNINPQLLLNYTPIFDINNNQNLYKYSSAFVLNINDLSPPFNCKQIVNILNQVKNMKINSLYIFLFIKPKNSENYEEDCNEYYICSSLIFKTQFNSLEDNNLISLTSTIMLYISIAIVIFDIIYLIITIKKYSLLQIHIKLSIGVFIQLIYSFYLYKWPLIEDDINSDNNQEELWKKISNYYIFIFLGYKCFVINSIINIKQLYQNLNNAFILILIIIGGFFIIFLLGAIIVFEGYILNDSMNLFSMYCNGGIYIIINILAIIWYFRRQKKFNRILSINDVRYQDSLNALRNQIKIINYHILAVFIFDLVILILYKVFYNNYKIIYIVNHYIDFIILLMLLIVYFPRELIVPVNIRIDLLIDISNTKEGNFQNIYQYKHVGSVKNIDRYKIIFIENPYSVAIEDKNDDLIINGRNEDDSESYLKTLSIGFIIKK